MVYDVQMHNFSGCAPGPLGLNPIYQQFHTYKDAAHV
jgi:hypothetical protein